MIRGEERRIVNDLELKKVVLYCRKRMLGVDSKNRRNYNTERKI